MTGKDETSALREVQERLAKRFPHLDAQIVEAAVRVAYSRLDGPIREFVPVLVERMARDRLLQMVSQSPAPAYQEQLTG